MAEAKAPAPAGVESEAKLRASRRVFAALEGAQEAGGWQVTSRRDVSLRDTYWDTPDGYLARTGSTLRVREENPQPSAAGGGAGALAELTLKGPLPDLTAANGAVWHRSELTAHAPAGSGPAAWATLPEAMPVVEALAALGARPPADGESGGSRSGADLLRRLRPDVVLRNPRREIVLEGEGSEAVLSLDEVAVEGMPYRRRYVEVELKRGSTAALDRLVDALQAQYSLRPSRQGKVQAARAWLARRRAS
jgi:hypothetical protein